MTRRDMNEGACCKKPSFSFISSHLLLMAFGEVEKINHPLIGVQGEAVCCHGICWTVDQLDDAVVDLVTNVVMW